MNRITLYHYTRKYNALSIEKEKVVRGSNPSTTSSQYRQHGDGVYFTSLSPNAVSPEKLALNNFTKNATYLRNQDTLYEKMQYVVEITFDKNEVEKKDVYRRDVYLHKGSIDLRRYEGRYRIYKNLKCPIKD